MEANPMSLYALFGQDQRLVVPVFQRPYVWNENRNWRPLWEDVAALVQRKLSGEEVHPHFLGAVVLDQLATSTGSMPARQVIDGQQRLTTLQVLLAAVRDVAREMEVAEKYGRALTKLIVNDDDMSDDPCAVYKVWPTNLDRRPFRAVMDGDLQRAVDVTTPTGTGDPVIVQAYQFFRARTIEWAHELRYEGKLEEGFNSLVRVLREKFELIVIDLKPDDNAQVIFEALNDRGTPLQASDLVKNLVFQRAEEQGLPVEALHREVWSYLETPDWRKEVRQGRLKRPRLDVFLTQYLTCELAEEVLTPELFLTFRQYVNDSGTDLVALIRHLVDRAAVYRRLTADIQPPTPEGRFLHALAVLDINTVMPVMLWLMTRYTEADRADAVAALESYLVRRTVCRQTTKNYNRLFLELLKELKTKDDPAVVEGFLLRQDADSGFWPRDEDIRYVFRTQPLFKQLTRGRLRLLLGELEDALYEGKAERMVYDGELTIEHLLPQAWEVHWPLPDPGSLEAHERRQSLVHTAGNLTLLSRKLNPSVSNGPWERKRPEILLHSALALNRRLPEQWDDEAIVARADHLAAAFCGRWLRPAGGAAPASMVGTMASRPAPTTPSVSRPAGLGVPKPRRDVGLHMQEAFASLPVGAVLTVAEIVAVRTSQYEAGEISAGAVAARLASDNVPGIRAVSGSSPRAARKIG
ncbi:DUF262 domain-containing HNH endonuclease family protein [Streptomyces sp. NPDC002133]|uniref:DUF262 domain-containing protein n=1 Tax=Streptomyces sp. NPDC002133 TaxID=3154409 RepID=UPI0033188B02